ncbi:MAG: Ni/Fe-hydrogenase, b-type cytochrome subunit, partial [Aestuariibacter sp.]|nr:Ni/Fe-hydrogenase, b-type cytochrome subunit [Aestuariibacter sp.]
MSTSVKRKDLTDNHHSGEEKVITRRQTAVYVYEAPVRLWHWVTVFSIITLCITG